MDWQNLKINWIRLSTYATIALSMVACGPNAAQMKNDLAKQQQNQAQANRVTGPLDEINRKIIAQPDSMDKGACDLANAEIRKNLIQSLEERYGKETTSSNEAKPEAKAGEEKPVKANAPVKVAFQGSYLLKIEKTESESKDEWQILTSSWKKEQTFFEKYSPVNSNAFWGRLYADVRTLLETDLNRIRQGSTNVVSKNLGISKDTVKQLPALHEHMKACAAQKDCFNVEWTDDELATIKKIPIYNHFLEKMSTASTNDKKRAVLEKWYGFVRDDQFEYSFKKNSTVKYSVEDKKDIFTLPLTAQALTDEEKAFLKDSIESIWKSELAEVRIEWKNPGEVKDIFQVVFHKETGIRASTSPFAHTVDLYTATDNRAIAHEIGHVLGFPEHYYPVWNSESCAYETQYSIDDLMSNQKLGNVSSDDWDELKKEYAQPAS